MTHILDEIDSREHYEHSKSWVNLRIYQRMNETFLVSKSTFWRRKSNDNNVGSFFKLSSCPAKFLCLAQSSSGQSQFQVILIQKLSKIFSLFVCLRTLSVYLCGFELSQLQLWNDWSFDYRWFRHFHASTYEIYFVLN